MLLILAVVTLFSGAASEGYDRLWQFHLIQDIGFPDAALPMAVWFGLISAVSTLLGIAGVHFAERKLDMRREQSLTAAMLVVTAVRLGAITLLAYAPGFLWALTAVLILGVAGSVSDPIYTTWLNMRLESRSRATAVHDSQSDALGQTAGAALVGYIGSRFSARLSLLTSAVLLLPAAVLFSRLLHKR